MSDRRDRRDRPIVLAFSGGLDTSYCVPWLRETHGRPVVTVTVDTGGLDAAAARGAREARPRSRRRRPPHWSTPAAPTSTACCASSSSATCGAAASIRSASAPSARSRRRRWRAAAQRLGCPTVAHGCTAAGNDQVRFEVALRALAPELEILAPVRDEPRSRARGGRVPGGARPAGAAARRRLLDQPRPVGRHDRRPGDADQRRRRCPKRPGCSPAAPSTRPPAPERHRLALRARRARRLGRRGRSIRWR